MDLPRISRYISLILRHKPWVAGITLDHHGWADVEELLAGVSKKYPIDKGILEEIVRTDNKRRYSFNENKTKIRANQGHSIPVDVELHVVTASWPTRCLRAKTQHALSTRTILPHTKDGKVQQQDNQLQG